MLRALILTNSYYDTDEADNDVLVTPGEDMDSVMLVPWPNGSNGTEVHITREELLAILDLIPVEA